MFPLFRAKTVMLLLGSADITSLKIPRPFAERRSLCIWSAGFAGESISQVLSWPGTNMVEICLFFAKKAFVGRTPVRTYDDLSWIRYRHLMLEVVNIAPCIQGVPQNFHCVASVIFAKLCTNTSQLFIPRCCGRFRVTTLPIGTASPRAWKHRKSMRNIIVLSFSSKLTFRHLGISCHQPASL